MPVITYYHRQYFCLQSQYYQKWQVILPEVWLNRKCIDKNRKSLFWRLWGFKKSSFFTLIAVRNFILPKIITHVYCTIEILFGPCKSKYYQFASCYQILLQHLTCLRCCRYFMRKTWSYACRAFISSNPVSSWMPFLPSRQLVLASNSLWWCYVRSSARDLVPVSTRNSSRLYSVLLISTMTTRFEHVVT